MSKKIDVDLLARFQPLNALSPENLQAILKQLKLVKLDTEQTLFTKGESDAVQYYLLKGEINLLGDSGILKSIKSGTTDSLNAIVHILPRTVTAVAKTDCIVFKIDANLIDVMLTWDQTGNFQVSEFSIKNEQEEDDWMSRILQTEAFHRIPPTNIQAIFMRMESVPVKAGEKIMAQGDDGDYFFIIKKGRALVTRSMPNQPKGIKLAELKDGDTFGEEALISSDKRNATITMLTDGLLSRLSKNDFLELLNEPLLNWVNYDDGQKQVDEGAQWLDVRLPAEHQANAINGSAHIPLIFLRMKIDSLDQKKHYVVYCDTGRRSSAASYLLNERGFTTCILEDGISAVPEEKRTTG
jgi:CRP-like cAMP-binding protein/rhodanese-related sulfurtransferase